MISLLRGLMSSDANTNRPLPSLILLGIVDFICFLMAAESYKDGKPLAAIKWLIPGIVSAVIGYYWPKIKRKLWGASSDELPEFRPHILPVEYCKAEKDARCGLYIRNPGYDALDVEIPSVRIGQSAYNLVFPERLAQFGERSGNAFLEAWLEPIQAEKVPGRGGCDLREIMRNSDTDLVNVGIIYKDTEFRSYKTNCVIERTTKGLGVKAISQEMVTS